MLSILVPLSVVAAAVALCLLIYRFPGQARGALRTGLAVAVGLVSFILVGGVSFVAAMFLAGPHAGIVPESYAPFVFLAAIAISLGLPMLAAWAVARRLRRRGPARSIDHALPP